MALTPKQVLQKFNSKKTLQSIAEKRGLTLNKQQRKRVADILAEDVIKTGMNRVLAVLKSKNLKELAKHESVKIDRQGKEDKWFPHKSLLIPLLTDAIAEYGVNQFFEDFDQKVLLECCKVIDDLEDYNEDELAQFSQEDLVNGIMTNIYTFGLQNLFSAFTITELVDFCEDCDLTVRSNSKEILIDCLIEQKDYRKTKRKSKVETMSTKKPKLKDGVRKIDLEGWFKRSELEDFCRKNKMKLGGSKRDLAKRILLYFEGDRTSKVMPTGRKSKKSKESKSKDETSE